MIAPLSVSFMPRTKYAQINNNRLFYHLEQSGLTSGFIGRSYCWSCFCFVHHYYECFLFTVIDCLLHFYYVVVLGHHELVSSGTIKEKTTTPHCQNNSTILCQNCRKRKPRHTDTWPPTLLIQNKHLNKKKRV